MLRFLQLRDDDARESDLDREDCQDELHQRSHALSAKEPAVAMH